MQPTPNGAADFNRYVQIMNSRDFFPTMPDEVFIEWINPLIKVKGWPFKSIDDDLQKTDWKYLLGIRSTLRKWFNSKWHLLNLFYPSIKLSASSGAVVKDIISHCAFGLNTETANVENTKCRFEACASFVRANGYIPSPLVLTERGGGYSIMDGNHRFAAFAFVHRNTQNPPELPAWIVIL